MTASIAKKKKYRGTEWVVFIDVKQFCGHENTFVKPAPLVGEEQWCWRCMDYSEVVWVVPPRKASRRKIGYN